MAPTVSVITPTHNRANLLPRAVKSVLNQTFGDFELIIIDDGSTDNTKEVLNLFNDPRIIFESFPENRGVNAARNRGLDLAKGKFVVFLDDDDELLPDALEKFVNFWKEVKDEKIGNIVTRCIDSKTGKKVGYLEKDNLILEYKDIICQKRAKGEFLFCWKREAIGEERFEEKVIGCESILWWRLAKKWNFLFRDFPTRIYYTDVNRERLTGVNSAIKNAQKLALGTEISLKENLLALKNYCPEELCHHFLAGSYYHLLGGNKKRARQLINQLFFKEKIFSLLGLIFYFLSFLPKNLFLFLAKLRYKFKNF